MAVDFVCGWECRLVAAGASNSPAELHWNSFNGVPGISTTTKRTGAVAGRLNPAAATMYYAKTFSRSVIAGRHFIRFVSFPSTGSPTILALQNANGTASLRIASSGQVSAIVGTGSSVNVGSPLSTGVWYRLDWLADSTGASTTLKVKLDGGTEVTATNAQVAVAFSDMRLGATGTTTYEMLVDDLVCGDATGDYPFGDGTVEGLVPTSDGTHSFTAADFGYNSAGGDVSTSATDVWSFVDDGDASGISDFIRQKVIRTTGYVEVKGFTPTSGADPIAVAVVLSMHAAGTQADSAGWKLNDNGTVVAINNAGGTGLTDISNTTVAQIYKVFATRPSGGTAWTNAALTGMKIRFGYSGDVADIPYWDGVVLEVAFPAGGVTHNGTLDLTGTGAIGNAGGVTYAGALSVTGTATVARPLTGTYAGALAVTGTGALGLTGGVIVPGSLALAGAGSFGQNGVVTYGGALSVTGTGALGNAGTATYAGALAVSGTGQFGAAGSAIWKGVLSVTGTGALSQLGGVIVPASLSVAGSGAIAGSPSMTWGGALSITGTGLLGQGDTGLWAGSLALTGTGALGQPGGVVRGGSASFTGTGVLGLSGGVTMAGSLSVTGTAVANRNGTVTYAGALGLTGTGTLGQNGIIVGASSSLAVTGTGAVSFGGTVAYGGSLSVAGQGSIGEAGSVVRGGALALAGSGTLGPAGGIVLLGGWAPIGIGSFGLSGQAIRRGSLSVLGIGTLGQNGDLVDTSNPFDPGATGSVTLGGLSGTVTLAKSRVSTGGLSGDVKVGGVGGKVRV